MEAPEAEKAEMKPRYEVVPATDENRLARAGLLQAAWREAYPNEEAGITRADIYEFSKGFTSPERLAEVKKDEDEEPPGVRFCVALAGKIIGFGNVNVNRNEVMGMYVHPDYYGKGAGAKLMQEAIAKLDRSRDITLLVASYNERAISFYKRFGFIEEGAGRARPIGNGKALPTVRMRRPVSTLK